MSSKAVRVESETEKSTRSHSRTRESSRRTRSDVSQRRLEIRSSEITRSSFEHKRRREKEVAVDIDERKRFKFSDSRITLKRSQSNVTIDAIVDSEMNSLASQSTKTFDNRVHCCLIISSTEQSLCTFRSSLKLSTVTRDAIISHRFLFTTSKILHQDISENNIIIANSERLIDLNLRKKLNSDLSDVTHRTDTMQFMTIEILRHKSHTYRYDLKSFFYVFL